MRIHTLRMYPVMLGKPNTKGFPLLKTQGKFMWHGAFQATHSSLTYALKAKGIPKGKEKEKGPLVNTKNLPEYFEQFIQV